ncbi:HipA family kinase [Oceanimonas smirnovii]|uniref:HipA family kinase n=1 Tax=Oceanimonas smirnovii TaxID=264574 RepID=UPI00036D6A63|nr:HipA family kinase [Oceanimonas smirnovii]
MNYIQIKEIIEQANAGSSNPYLCQGMDDVTYMVKSPDSLPAEQLVYEWVSAGLARAFGLPCPTPVIIYDFGCLWSLQSNLSWSSNHDYSFAMPFVSNAMDMTYAQSLELDSNFKRDLFIFDYWIQNADRMLSSHGGNVNLLYDNAQRKPVVIDHNLAFTPGFVPNTFSHEHVFGYDNRPDFRIDLVDQCDLGQRLDTALGSLNTIVASMPEEWHDEANNRLSCDVIDDHIRPILEKCNKPDFWQDVEP